MRVLAVYGLQQCEAPPDNNGYFLSTGTIPVWRIQSGLVYAPSEDEELQLRVIVAIHFDLGAPRVYNTTCEVTKTMMHWANIEADVRAFV